MPSVFDPENTEGKAAAQRRNEGEGQSISIDDTAATYIYSTLSGSDKSR
jgi:hypothetical protein